MERILNQKHDKATLLYSLSRLFERASYYGLRSLIILYMIGETIKMPQEKAFNIYGILTISILFSQILGALIGDLILGNRKAIIIGGIVQAIGAFSFCIPSTAGLYIGLCLVVLGGGLYSPNMISLFGKQYLNKTKILDSAFTIFYTAVNVGSFMGILLIGALGEKFGYNYGFILAGFLMLISIIFPFIIKEAQSYDTNDSKTPLNQRIVKIISAFILVALFWAIYEISGFRVYDLQIKLSEYSFLNMPKVLMNSLNFAFILPMCIIFATFWSYFYSNQFEKLTTGFIFGALSFGLLFLIPEIPNEQHVIIYLLSMLLLSLSEIHISPIVYSILTQYANPKYLAIIISLAFIPTRILSYLLSFFNDKFYDEPIFALKVGMIVTIIISIGLLTFTLINKKTTYNTTYK